MLINNDSYFQILEDIKQQIKQTQYQALLGVNRKQIILYRNIGQKNSGEQRVW